MTPATEHRIPPAALADRARRVNEALVSLFPAEGDRTRVEQAMAWSLLAGGKRLRPVLLLAAARSLGAKEEPLLLPACGIECLHTYSLIHDDLPSMDDDVLRRGRPTCHVQFGESTAILAGDALHTLCFELILRYPEGEQWAARKARAATILARAVGRNGMVLGQELDLAAVGDARGDSELVDTIHRTKTALLLQACVLMGAVLAGADFAQEKAVATFGLSLGLAFQTIDDLLDVEGDQGELGKHTGGDAAAEKATAVTAWGVEGARSRAEGFHREATAALDDLDATGASTGELREILRFVLDRRH